MDIVRIGVIGMGNMGGYHAQYLQKGDVRNAKLAAVCSTSPHKLESYRTQGVRIFADGVELIRSGEVDAVVIATPHVQHAPLGIAALEAGVHVMVEKPIAVHKAEAERLAAAARAHPDVRFGAMFQMRTEPRYAKIRELIQQGALGRVSRTSWIITDWFRSDAYFASSEWRATWKGEGGGVLINQCLHQLDTLFWLFGLPASVRGFCQLGRYHAIEVEDDVTAYLRWPDGATGVFISSTGELPGTNRFEIAGTRGRLVLENDTLTLTRNAVPADEWARTSRVGFAKPEISQETIPFDDSARPHAAFMQNFVDAILGRATLNCHGAEGIGSIELANAILYSSLIDRTVELPLDGAAYKAKLGELVAGSTFRKKVAEVSSEDFSASFRR